MKTRALALTLISVLLFSAVAAKLNLVNVGIADSGVNDWPMFHYNLARSGCPDDIAPIAHDLLWSYDANASVGSSPAVVGGVVYIGSDDGKIYALNASTGLPFWTTH